MFFCCRVSYVERAALRGVRQKVAGAQAVLLAAFAAADPEQTGKVSMAVWCQTMERVLGLQLPWRRLSARLAEVQCRCLLLRKYPAPRPSA